FLTLQRIVDGHRFGAQYNGYRYDGTASPHRLIGIYSPSQTTPHQVTGGWDVATSGSPTPSLTVGYDSTGKVEWQVLGPAGVADERRFTIATDTSDATKRQVTPPGG